MANGLARGKKIKRMKSGSLATAKKLYTNSEWIAQGLRSMGKDVEVVECDEERVLHAGYYIVTDEIEAFEELYG